MPPHLCNYCVKVFEGSAPKVDAKIHNDDAYYIHHTYQSFALSSKTKCRLCSDLWASLASGIGHPVEDLAASGLIVAFGVTHFPDAEQKPAWIFLMCGFYVRETASPPAVLRNKYVEERLKDPHRFLLGGEWYQVIYNRIYVLSRSVAGEDKRSIQELGKSSSSQPSREIVNNWVRTCVENHPECRPWRDHNRNIASPARILDVGDHGSATVRLRDLADDEDFEEDYVTLTYCKGTSKMMEQNLKTLQTLKSAINPMHLPKTFRNAVAVTRQLGVRYLWISALCVFQDCVNDRRIEGRKSGDIYGNALLNICALGAEDCDGGLFFERDPVSVQPMQVNMSWPLYRSLGVSVPHTLYNCNGMGEFTDIMNAAAVNKRTWPWQEQFVSRRILYCCKEQLFWECRRGRGNESFPAGLGRASAADGGPIQAGADVLDRIAREGSWTMAKSGRMKFIPPSDEKLVEKAYAEWIKLIERVTACEVTLGDLLGHAYNLITRPEDLILAFAGIGRKFEILLGERYSAGLLLGNDFHNNILWFAKELWPWTVSYPPSTEALQWKATTWSWVSVLGKVQWEHPPLQSEVLDRGNFLQLLDAREDSAVLVHKGAVPPESLLRIKARKIFVFADTHRPLGTNLTDPGGIKVALVFTMKDGKVIFGYGQLDNAAYLPKNPAEDEGLTPLTITQSYLALPVRYWLEKAAWNMRDQTPNLKVGGLLVKRADNHHGKSQGECLNRIGRFTLEMSVLECELAMALANFENGEMGREYLLA